ncbi:hypothetical protein [Melittangium boletus]|uniref:hypothetical protein n=1 Tax=Melittangium boletus TaxID=83453 RepID=UPI003DA25582
MKHHPHPPHQAYALVSGEYHVVMDLPELQHRRLVSHPVLEFYLADRVRAGLPPPAATFRTHEEAQAWLDAQPEAPRQVVIQIAGEDHLAVYHHRVGVRALYALPRSEGLPP